MPQNRASMQRLLGMAIVLGCRPAGDQPPGPVDSAAPHDTEEPPEDTGPFDHDGDGWTAAEDCDDADASVHPEAEERWYDGVDQDCDGRDDDQDEDGHGVEDDCDDTDPAVYPGAEDPCDGQDSDCDGTSEEDADGDGVRLCDGDCDDMSADIGPHMEEVCNNGIDDDCDGSPGSCGVYGELSYGDADFYLEGYDHDYVGSEVTLLDTEATGEDRLFAGAHAFNHPDTYERNGGIFVYAPPYQAVHPPSDPVVVGQSEVSPYIGAYLGEPGDLDGDGYEELTLTENWRANYDHAIVWIVDGPLTGTVMLEDHTPTITALAPGGDDFGDDLGMARDQDGDGDDELLVGNPWCLLADPGCLYLYKGPVTAGISEVDYDVKITGEGDSQGFGQRVEGRYDLDGDGVADIVLSDPTYEPDGATDGVVYILPGPMDTSGQIADLGVRVTAVRGDSELGSSIFVDEDVDGDGLPDILVGGYVDSTVTTHQGVVHVICDFPTDHTDVSIACASIYGHQVKERVGYHVTGPGDVNGDGHRDLLTGGSSSGPSSPYGKLSLLLGPLSGTLSTEDAAAVISGQSGASLPDDLGPLGDINDDGFDDFFFSSFMYDSFAGGVFIYLGGSL